MPRTSTNPPNCPCCGQNYYSRVYNDDSYCCTRCKIVWSMGMGLLLLDMELCAPSGSMLPITLTEAKDRLAERENKTPATQDSNPEYVNLMRQISSSLLVDWYWEGFTPKQDGTFEMRFSGKSHVSDSSLHITLDVRKE